MESEVTLFLEEKFQRGPMVDSEPPYFAVNGELLIKSSMARSLSVENLLPQNVGSIINYLQ